MYHITVNLLKILILDKSYNNTVVKLLKNNEEYINGNT